MKKTNNSLNKKIYLIKEEIKNLESVNSSAISGLESELLKYSGGTSSIEVISIEPNKQLSDSIKKLF